MTKPRSTQFGPHDTTGHWLEEPRHREALKADARAQFDFFRASLGEDGRIYSLDRDGRPRREQPQELHVVTRLVHSYALGEIAGYEGAGDMVEAGLAALRSDHRDDVHGGYKSAVRGPAPDIDAKLAYGHAFVLLAGASATIAGHEGGRRLLDDVAEILEERFWDDEIGRLREEFAADWSPISRYRGMNANMHATEAMLAAHEATGDGHWLERAGRILSFFALEIAPANQWRLPEHYTEDWQIDAAYAGNPMFRPAGTTPGHSLELGRLLIQHWDLSGRPDSDAPKVARELVEAALRDAWRLGGGFAYTLSHGGAVDVADRYWWPVTEGIGAMATLIKLDGRADDEEWYRRFWTFASEHFVDRERGGWFPEIGEDGSPIDRQFEGKPDIYHAIQADLFPLASGVSRQAEGIAGCLRP